jgi:ABC-2 type transport system permease protein
MRILKLALRQIRYENKAFRRNPVSAFFTFAFPMLFLFIFSIVFSDREIEIEGGIVSLASVYIPMITVFAVVGSSYTGVAMQLSIARDGGVLKRIKGTPLPIISFILGKIGHSTLISTLLVLIVTMSGSFIMDVPMPSKNAMPPYILTLLLGAATFSCLGVAIVSLIPSADAAPAIVNASIIPLLFISDVFVPTDSAPVWLNMFAQCFPVRPFSIELQAAFNPFNTGMTFNVINLGIIGAWLIAGLLLSIKFFSWEPRT